VFKGFVAGKTQKYEQLKGEDAIRICFSKVNFLDLKEDNLLNRNYFPGVDLNSFDKQRIQLLRKLKRILGLPTKEL
jgi:phytoene/squalene synthetase